LILFLKSLTNSYRVENNYLQPHKYSIAVDFDGVLAEWTPYRGAHIIDGEPLPNALVWLFLMVQKFDVHIHSTRCRTWRGRLAIARWLLKHATPAMLNPYNLARIEKGKKPWRSIAEVCITKHKPPALVYIDDRAYRYGGLFKLPTAKEIHRDLRPWWQLKDYIIGVPTIARRVDCSKANPAQEPNKTNLSYIQETSCGVSPEEWKRSREMFHQGPPAFAFEGFPKMDELDSLISSQERETLRFEIPYEVFLRAHEHFKCPAQLELDELSEREDLDIIVNED
jgi:hypothetical protein